MPCCPLTYQHINNTTFRKVHRQKRDAVCDEQSRSNTRIHLPSLTIHCGVQLPNEKQLNLALIYSPIVRELFLATIKASVVSSIGKLIITNTCSYSQLYKINSSLHSTLMNGHKNVCEKINTGNLAWCSNLRNLFCNNLSLKICKNFNT